MPETLRSPANVLNSVDWFKAKLQFEIGPVELKRLIDTRETILVLDVRDRDSYGREHIPGAINIPFAELQRRLGEQPLPKDKTIVTYCYSITCHLATKAALDLAHLDYKVQEMIGGMEEWKKRELPVEGDDVAPRPEGAFE
jgi:rhodanese-related sulfurtransferase